MQSEIGTLYHTDGGGSWLVTSRVEMTAEPDGDSIFVTGEIEVGSGTGLLTNHSDGPLYLRLRDGLWATVYLSEQGSDASTYTITSGSQLIARPMWAVRVCDSSSALGRSRTWNLVKGGAASSREIAQCPLRVPKFSSR